MITFHSRQSDCARRTRKTEDPGTFNFASQIPSSICTVAFTKCEKSDAIIFTSRCSRLYLIYIFIHGHALLLSFVRFSQLANGSPKIARSPARRARDGRETSGKKSGKMSRVIFAQRPCNARTVAAAMPLNVRQDDLQDDWPCTGIRRAMSTPETCATTRTRFCNSRAAVCTMVNAASHDAACRILVIGF